MLYDGREYRHMKHLGFRVAHNHAFVDDNIVDVYADGGFTTKAGQRISGMHVVILRKKDAKIVTVGDTDYYDASTVPPEKCIPVCAHSATNVALGVPVIKTSSAGPKLNVGRNSGEHVSAGQSFVEQAHYLVKDGQVYQWTSRRLADKEDKAA